MIAKDRRRRLRRTPRSDRDKDEEVGRWPKDEEVSRRSKEQRKSLKEQECIERVTEFLARHSDLGFQEPEFDLDGPSGDLERPERPATLTSLDQTSRLTEASRPIRGKDSLKGTSLEEEGQAKVTSRSLLDGSEASRSLLDGSEAIGSEATKSPLDGSGAKKSPLDSSDPVRSMTKKMPTVDVPGATGSTLDGSDLTRSETKKTPTLEVSDTSLRPRIQGQEVKDTTEAGGGKLVRPEPETRRSSLRKRTFSRESSRESLLDEAKKEVRIQEDVQEIFFEEVSDQASCLLPEVQLVKARILTAEELSRCRTDEPEVRGPPEVAVVPGATRVRVSRVPSPEAVDTSQLQLPVLAKSTSENALIEAKDENRVSERNIKPEILLDLSKVTAVVQPEPEAERKGLSRTGSEGSKRFGKGFKVGCLARPDEPELMVLVEVSKRGSGPRSEPDILSWREGVSLRSEDSEAEQPDSGFDREQDEGPSVDSEDDYQRIPLRQQRARLLGDEGPKDEPSPFKVDQADVPLDLSLKDEQAPSGFKVDQARVPYDLGLKDEQPSSTFKVSGVTDWLEDELVRREHSLEYQSQTLESQADLVPVTGKVRTRLRDQDLEEEDEDEEEVKFKGTQISPKERRDAETQTEQVTKSTQCGYSGEPTPEPSPDCPSRSFRLESRSHQSPRREVQTQTQGESKSVQCSLEDLTVRSEPQDSPSRSKSVQCAPEDIQEEGKVEPERLGSRREVEVQTYQESKAVQCCEEDELLDREWTGSERLSTSSRRSESSVSEAILFVEEPRMTVTQREPGNDGGVAWAKHWGPERLVEIHREPKTSLGLSIVGGKVDLHNGSSSKSQNISGIFIKNVLPNSPAGRTGELKIGDRIIEVDGVDLRQSSHERAVEVIQAAGNPVCLLVQSLVHLQESKPETVDGEAATGSRGEGRRQSVRSRLPAPGTPTASFRQKPVSPARSITPEVIQGGTEGESGPSRSDVRRQSTRSTDGAGPSARRSSMKRSMRKKAPSPPSNPGVLRQVSEEREDHAPQPEAPPRRKYSSDESSEEEDTRELEGNVYTKAGIEISRKSAGNVKRSKQEIEADPEQEDEFGYTSMKVQKKYHGLGHKVLMVKVEKDRLGLGISLAGHKDRNRMAVFICGIHPKGAAHKTGELVVGDEILEVNGCVLQGRCHLNASAMIKGMAGPCFKIIVIRRTAAVDDLAVKPLVQFPPMLDEADQFKEYRGVRRIPVKKGQYGLGIMIIEGKHAEVGQGIFISDIQEGSAAEQAGLNVGDMILAVNMDCLLGSTYDEATSLLKKAEGVVTLTVCNPNQSKLAKEEEDRAKGIIPQEEKPAPKEPEKPKEPEPPQDPKDCKIQVGRDTTIEFQKDKDKGIGFTIAGGSDTPSNGVFILEVFPDGAAGKDGRLQAGDQILDFCNQSFKAIEHDKAHAAVLKASGTIVMVVHRQEKPIEEVDVELQKKSGKGAGLCLTGYKSGKGAYVSDLLPGGSALESGKISKGDQVVGVGGQDVREAPVEDIAVHVKVSNPVQLKLARFKSAKQ